MVEDSFQQGRVSKPWVSFRLAEKPWLRTQAGDISLALGLVESLKKHLTANNVNVEGPFKNSLGYVVITCKLPQSIDLLIFPGIKSDPNRWHIRLISSTPFLRRVFSKWRTNSSKVEYEAWQTVCSFIDRFLEEIRASDVTWLTSKEAEFEHTRL